MSAGALVVLPGTLRHGLNGRRDRMVDSGLRALAAAGLECFVDGRKPLTQRLHSGRVFDVTDHIFLPGNESAKRGK